MIKFSKDIVRVILRHARSLAMWVGIFVAALVLIGLGVSWRMQKAEFCSNCHYMEPYVRHWKASKHADVACVKCHDYGVRDLTAAALKYWTGTYTSRPKANVFDKNCLASGCHELRLLKGTTQYKKNISFDHAAHLDKPLRGEKLRCTSCHNQIVQFDETISGGHMAVNDKSCFVCHFKDAGQGEAITGCDACHGMPKTTVEHAGFKFDHAPYLKLKVECKECHTKIVKGNGAVPENKCYSCHVERSRQQHTRDELHSIHVTTNGIDCFNCHSDIEHGNYEMVSALDIQCENCHVRQHNGPKQLYMGIGGRDTLDMPSPMFAAQVSCTGCHTHLTPQGEPLALQERKEAQRASCVTCHGEGYDKMFDNWLEGSQKALSDFESYLKTVKADAASLGGNKGSRAKLTAAIANAEYNYDFVKGSHMPHNIWYSLYLFGSSANQVKAAMGEINSSHKAPELGAAVIKENSCLTFCHGKKPLPEKVDYAGKKLPHQMHIKELEVSCKNCHSVNDHGKLQIDKEACKGCHEGGM